MSILEKIGIESLRGSSKLPLAILGVVTLAACGTLQPPGSQGLVARDVLEIKQLLKDQKEEQASTQRKTDYRLDTLDENVHSRTDLLKTNLADTDKTIRAQGEQLEKLRKQVEDLSYQIAALGNKLGMQPAPQPADKPADTAGTKPAGGEDDYAEALKQFHLGRYEAARKGFEQVLAKNPTGDALTQAQFYLGESSFALNDLPSAHDQYTKLITGNPSHLLAWQSLERLAQISQKQGRTAEALKLYDQIITRNPNYEGLDRVKAQVDALKKGGGPAPEAAQNPAPAQPPAANPAPAPKAP